MTQVEHFVEVEWAVSIYYVVPMCMYVDVELIEGGFQLSEPSRFSQKREIAVSTTVAVRKKFRALAVCTVQRLWLTHVRWYIRLGRPARPGWQSHCSAVSRLFVGDSELTMP